MCGSERVQTLDGIALSDACSVYMTIFAKTQNGTVTWDNLPDHMAQVTFNDEWRILDA